MPYTQGKRLQKNLRQKNGGIGFGVPIFLPQIFLLLILFVLRFPAPISSALHFCRESGINL